MKRTKFLNLFTYLVFSSVKQPLGDDEDTYLGRLIQHFLNEKELKSIYFV